MRWVGEWGRGGWKRSLGRLPGTPLGAPCSPPPAVPLRLNALPAPLLPPNPRHTCARQVAIGILKRMGCTAENIVTAEDGEAALEAVAAAGGPDAFDVILMDLHMPRKVWGGGGGGGGVLGAGGWVGGRRWGWGWG